MVPIFVFLLFLSMTAVPLVCLNRQKKCSNTICFDILFVFATSTINIKATMKQNECGHIEMLKFLFCREPLTLKNKSVSRKKAQRILKWNIILTCLLLSTDEDTDVTEIISKANDGISKTTISLNLFFGCTLIFPHEDKKNRSSP